MRGRTLPSPSPSRLSIPLALACPVLLLCAPGCLAQDAGCSAASSVSDARFTLSSKEGRTVFQSGEIVALKLSFTASTPHRYWADDRNYDRSGRLSLEAYCLTPDTADPLTSYFSIGGFIGGGLGGLRALDTTPFTAEADLNEWRRLPPGRYRVYAISQRVWRPPDPREQTPYGRVAEVLRSNTVEFVVNPPDARWQAAQLQAATQALAANPSYEEARRAARTLRFLNTAGSARQLARLFWGINPQQPAGWELLLGLYGSPFPSIAIESMNAELAEPSHPVTGEFLALLVNLQIGVDPAWKPPAFTQADIEPSRLFWQRRKDRVQELTTLALRKVAEALPRKVGAARAFTLLQLLSGGEAISTDAGKLRAELATVWNDLPRESQSEWIQYRWPLIAGPELLPALRRLAAETPPPPRTTRAMARDAALKHIHELDPGLGRALIRQDALNPTAQPDLDLLRLLPSEDIAAILPPAAERIAHGQARELDYELLDRFADAGLLPGIQATFQQHLGQWACAPQSAMLRYFLRVDPPYGATQVKASLSARKDTHCYSGLLQSLGNHLPHVQILAIESLDDPDPDLVQDAVAALGAWGDPSAETALWARLQRFRQEWAGREDELRSTPDYQSPGPRAVALEQTLVRALASGRTWLYPPAKLARLASLVLTRQQALQIETWIQDWNRGPAVVTPSWRAGGDIAFSLLQYNSLTPEQLRTKLTQFPSGTHLRWQFWQPGQIQPPVTMQRQDALYETMRAFAANHGVALDPANHP
ncbi:hypothetical protein [Paludibaculum fermentans]|uniref:hypothetical protein n=1 Tax=Paludibaculum fermentans TaxID=1473598 RepID=UPI003EC0E7E8